VTPAADVMRTCFTSGGPSRTARFLSPRATATQSHLCARASSVPPGTGMARRRTTIRTAHIPCGETAWDEAFPTGSFACKLPLYGERTGRPGVSFVLTAGPERRGVTDTQVVLGTWLRSRRKSADLSQEQLAGRAGMSIRALRDIEAGRTEYPHPASVRRLADALHLPSPDRAEFLGLAQRPPADDVTAPRAVAGPVSAVSVIPHQLPASVRQFAGRERELALLAGLVDDAVRKPAALVISAVDGSAGIGKTALAVQFAHQAADSFADGQLYVNLAAFGPSVRPVTPGQALRGFLDALGAQADHAPSDLQGQIRLYRSLVAGRRILIVLDNAADEEQVRPLLPGTPGCLAVVTSRRKLAGLAAAEGAVLITLDYLPDNEAVQLLAARIGERRVAAEAGAAGDIVRLCAGMPLALTIAAARAAARPRFPLADMAAELAASASPLDPGAPPTSSVRVAFSWSYQQLDPASARMFRLLGLHPGPDISAPAAASLAGISEPDARRLLRELAAASLITEHTPGRYTLHNLLREYAAELTPLHDSNAEREAALSRMLDHYLHTAAAAAAVLMPGRDPVGLATPVSGCIPEQPATRHRALNWFEAEDQVLLGAIARAGSGFDSHAWQLAWAMAAFLQIRGRWQDWAVTQRTALTAATRLGDTAAQALTGRMLALACTELGDHDQARTHYATSLALYQHLGNRVGEAKIHQSLGILAERQGRYADALGHCEQALRLYQAAGERAGQAEALNNVGCYYDFLGDHEQARVFSQQAVTLSAETGHPRTAGLAWDSLGCAEGHLGNLAEAGACFQRAVSLLREAGDRFNQSESLTHLGDNRHAAGEPVRARQAWQQALAILDELHHPNAGQVRAKLATANSPEPRGAA
jgi:tetratricopeptide (TPR) repeat protein/transcriptional regulator with XRE-family HTH domain